VTETSAITDSIVEKPEYDFNRLTFLLLSFYSTKMIIVPRKGYNHWNEVAAAMKKGPVKMSVSTFGASNHIAGIIMNEKAKTNFKIIVFPGTAESMNALLRGDAPLSLLTENAASGLLEAEEVRVLLELTNGTKYPGAVSLKELGVPEIAGSMNNSQYIVAPPNLAEEPRDILIEALKRATNDKEFEAWASKSKLNLGKTYGEDARKLYQGFTKYYEDIAPILIKHLK
jgi:tripartite-type tricarboxylate transporter receptor subunit TctC